mmetsp:Transcript_5521/g.13000  ORF Transcript_5521/g.13000 Transcript_5521/m.13000 type:complete len:84 (+) Transcript_5521:2151-2402(+)
MHSPAPISSSQGWSIRNISTLVHIEDNAIVLIGKLPSYIPSDHDNDFVCIGFEALLCHLGVHTNKSRVLATIGARSDSHSAVS